MLVKGTGPLRAGTDSGEPVGIGTGSGAIGIGDGTLALPAFSGPEAGASVQLGKNVLAMYLAACPRVEVLLGRKYGRFVGLTQGSPGPPHG